MKHKALHAKRRKHQRNYHDIESRIAELFSERITSDQQVISSKIVDEIINIMGQEDYNIDDSGEGTKARTTETGLRLARQRQCFCLRAHTAYSHEELFVHENEEEKAIEIVVRKLKCLQDKHI